MATNPMSVLASSFGGNAFNRMKEETSIGQGLGHIQNAWKSSFQRPAQSPSSIPQPPQEPAPAPQAAAGAVSQFEQMVEAARPQGWPAVDGVYKQQLTNLWQSGENKAEYDATHRRYIEEEGLAAAAGVSGQTV
jgi:hypothetical protein